jgi:hypothetical protein
LRSVQERYKTDPVFRTIVMTMLQMFQMTGEGITPSEIREAMGLAWQLYTERHPSPIMMMNMDRHDGISRTEP